MINVLIIDKDKNTIIVDLIEEEYKQVFSNKLDSKRIKRHKTIKELDSEVRGYLKEKKEDSNNEQ